MLAMEDGGGPDQQQIEDDDRTVSFFLTELRKEAAKNGLHGDVYAPLSSADLLYAAKMNEAAKGSSGHDFFLANMLRLIIQSFYLCGAGIFSAGVLWSIPFASQTETTEVVHAGDTKTDGTFHYYNVWPVSMLITCFMPAAFIMLHGVCYAAMYGWGQSRTAMLGIAAACACVVAVLSVLATASAGELVMYYHFAVVSYGVMLLCVLVLRRHARLYIHPSDKVPRAIGEAESNAVSGFWNIPLSTGLNAACLALYCYLLVPAYIRGGLTTRLILRLAVHSPAEWLCTSVARWAVAPYEAKRAHVYLAMPQGCFSMLGRLLVCLAGGTGETLVLAAAVAFLDLITYASRPMRAKMFPRIFDAINADVYGPLLNARLCWDIAGYVSSYAAILFLYKYRLVFDIGYSDFGDLGNYDALYAFLIQCALHLTVVVIIVGTADRFLNLDLNRAWHSRSGKMWAVECAACVLAVSLVVVSTLTVPLSGVCSANDPCTCDFPLHERNLNCVLADK